MRLGVATSLVVLMIFGVAAPVGAQQWASKMFEVKEHDFGTVARGADVVYRFPAKNIYRQDIELVSVRSSCGCTSPSLENKLLKTHEVGYVVAKFNTRTFQGVHGATLTVTLRWTDNRGISRTGEAQLRVNGDIRSDLVFQPGSVRFEPVDQGTPAEQRIRISYAGRNEWEVTNVLSKMAFVEAELIQHDRQNGRVTYDLLVRLKETAPAGDLRGQLVLVTSDSRDVRIPLIVEGRVMPEISVAPDSLVLGEVLQGQTVSKRVLVRGKKPFRIVDVSCDDDCFSFAAPDEAGDRHVVELTFKADREPGDVREQINFATDLGDEYHTTCIVHATVLPSESTAESAGETASAAVKANGAVQLATGQ